jgi:hypothetical protein
MTTKTKNVYQRINAVMQKVSYIQKEQKRGMQYSIVSHDKVTALLRDHFVEEGLAYHPVGISASQDGNRTQVQLTVRFVNVDNPEDFFDVPSLGYGIDQQDKGPGKAISYAVKYALLKTFGLETGDDPDEDQATKHVSQWDEWLEQGKKRLDKLESPAEIDNLAAKIPANAPLAYKMKFEEACDQRKATLKKAA